MTYQYPGEDPNDVLNAAFAIDDAQIAVASISKAWADSASKLDAPGVWSGDTADAAAHDAGKLTEIMSKSTKNLSTIYTALTTYSTALSTIRYNVDELNAQLAKQQTALAAGQNGLRITRIELESGDITPAEARTESSTASTAVGHAATAMAGLDADYQNILKNQRTAADTCKSALATLPDGSKYTYGSNYGTALGSALRLGALDIGPLIKAKSDATTLAGLKQPLDPNDPTTKKLITDLNTILSQHKNAAFDTPFLSSVGPSRLVTLSGMLATMYHGTKPPAIMSTVGSLESQLGDAVAAATRHIGSSGNPPQLPQSWVDGLKTAGQTPQTFDVGGTIGKVTIRGYVPLMAMLGSGSGYGSGLMTQLGDDMKSFEQSHGGSGTWLPSGTNMGGYSQGGKANGEFPMKTDSLNWDWSGDKNPAADDPFSSWSVAMAHSPATARSVLANDNPLTNYLLNQRDWGNEQYGHIQQGSNNGWYGTGGGDGPGLKVFGDMIGSTDDPHDPNSQTVLHNVITDLGENSNNPRLKGSFAGNDWIPDELRTGVATLVSHHLVEVNEAMGPGSITLPKTDTEYVLGDLAKNQDAYKILYQSEAAHAGYTITDALKSNNSAAGALATQYGNTDAWLDHGAKVGFADASTAGAEAHNSLIDGAGQIFKLAAGSAAEAGEAATGTEAAGSYVDAGVDGITDRILKQFESDPGPAIAVNSQNIEHASNTSILTTSVAAVYNAMTPAQQSGIFPGGVPATLSPNQVQQVLDQLNPVGQQHESAAYSRYYDVVTAASQAYNNPNYGAAS